MGYKKGWVFYTRIQQFQRLYGKIRAKSFEGHIL